MSNSKIAVAVAAIVAAGAAAGAYATVLPTQGQAAGASATQTFYLAGSSAAVSGFGSAVGADICLPGTLTSFVTNPAKQPNLGTATASKTPDFRAFSCFSNGVGGLTTNTVVTIYYRAEGGSVVGVFAPYNNLAVNELNLSVADCEIDAAGSTQFDCATSNNPNGVAGQTLANEVVGNSPTNGPADSYTGAVSTQTIMLGISDVEPSALGNSNGPSGKSFPGAGNNDPTNVYCFLTAGSNCAAPNTNLDATDDQLATWEGTNSQELFQQTFGFIVNTSGASSGATSLTSQQIASALNSASAPDWHSFVNTIPAGNPLVVCHRDLGSGTRTAADVVFTQDGCNGVGAVSHLNDLVPANDSFSTGDVLACVNNTANSIGYVSVDNFSKVGAAPYASTKVLLVDGIQPSNQITASTGWSYAVEAAANYNTTFLHNAFLNHVVSDLQTLATAPQSAQVNAIPGLSTNVTNPNADAPLKSGSIYVTSWGRAVKSFNSCTPIHKE